MFENLPPVPQDPILGLIQLYKSDPRADKVDLGVGVYRDEAGMTPVLSSVKKAEGQLLEEEDSKSYLGPLGSLPFLDHIAELALGKNLWADKGSSMACIQTPGGCGALRLAAEITVRAHRGARVWVSDPSWGNHRPLLGGAGLPLQDYPYYNHDTHTVDFEAMCAALNGAASDDLVLVHASCHNPCGADLSPAQWDKFVALAQERGFSVLIDMAYQGFGDGLEQDAYGLRKVMSTLPESMLTISCSKNFGLYRERVGALIVAADSEARAQVISGNLAGIARGHYSMPPAHGASIVATILADESLSKEWRSELDDMRNRIQATRASLVSQLNSRGCSQFDFVQQHKGMFSFLGISPDQVHRLAADFGIYMVDSSRISLAGLNNKNLDYFCDALVKVV